MKIILDQSKYDHIAIRKLFESNVDYERLEEVIIKAYEYGYEMGREAGYQAGFEDCLEFDECFQKDK